MRETTNHPASRDWGEDTINSGSAYGVAALVRKWFYARGHPPKVCARPMPLAVALEVVHRLHGQPHVVPIRPGSRPRAIVEQLLRASDATGNLVPDAFHAALAIDRGADWITTDKGFYASRAIVYWVGRVYPLTVAHDAFYPSSAVIVVDS